MVIRVILLWVFCLSLPLSGMSQTQTLDSLRLALSSETNDSVRVNLMNQMAIQLNQAGNLQESRRLTMEVLRRSSFNFQRDEYLDGLLNLAEIFLIQEKPDSALIPIREGLSLARTLEERISFINMEANALRYDGKPQLALNTYETALSLSDSLDNPMQKARIRANMAVVYSTLGYLSAAFENHYQSLQIAEAERDSSFMVVSWNNLGLIFYETGDFDQAEYFFRLSMDRSADLGMVTNLIQTQMNLGMLYSAMSRFEEAEESYQMAIELSQGMGDLVRPVRINYQLGMLELRKNNITEAERRFREVLTVSNQMNLGDGIYFGSLGLGDLEMQRNNFTQAVGWFSGALRTAESQQAGLQRLQAGNKLVQAYKGAGNNREALLTLEAVTALTDSLRSRDRDRTQAEFETMFDLKRRDQENQVLMARQSQQEAQLQLQRTIIAVSIAGFIILVITVVMIFRTSVERKRTNLRLEEHNKQIEDQNTKLENLNKTIKNQNVELEQLNHIKSKMFAIVAHDLRGPMSSLQSLLYLLRDHKLSPDDMAELTTSLEINLQENASTMDNLLAWARSQMSGITLNYRDFTLLEAVNVVKAQARFQAESKGINLLVDVSPQIEVSADYDMMKLVFRNLIANAIKFCEKEDRIEIKAEMNDDEVIVAISDTGMGIKNEDQEKIFAGKYYTSKGTKNEKGSGLGLSLCKEFVEQHGGQIWFESKEGEGTTFFFTIPTVSRSEKSVKKESVETEAG